MLGASGAQLPGAERAGRQFGAVGDWLVLSKLVFRLWHGYRRGTLDREQLREALEPVQMTM